MLSHYQKLSTRQSLKYTQDKLNSLLDLESCLQDNLLDYLYQTAPMNVDLSTSPLRLFFKNQINIEECYQFHYVHEADRKYVMFEFLYEFLRDESNAQFHVLCLEWIHTINAEQLAGYFEERLHKDGKTKEVSRKLANNYLGRIQTYKALTKNQQKITLLTLPFIIESNRRIKCIILSEINAFEHDSRAKSIDKTIHDLTALKLFVLVFRKDHPSVWKDSLIHRQQFGDSIITQASERLCKVLTPKYPKEYIRYVAPAEEYRAKIVEKKEDVFRSILITPNNQDAHSFRLIIFSTRPFQMREELIGRGPLEISLQ